MSGKPSLKAEIYEAVLSDIIQGIYKQNEIITEKQLIAKYGVKQISDSGCPDRTL